MTRWIEDFAEGEALPLGRYLFTRKEAQEFNALYEPGVVNDGYVSGWLLALTAHRLMLEWMFREEEIILARGDTPGHPGPAPGMHSITFHAPLPYETALDYTRYIKGYRLSKSMPGWGIQTSVTEGRSLDGTLIYSAHFSMFVGARTAA